MSETNCSKNENSIKRFNPQKYKIIDSNKQLMLYSLFNVCLLRSFESMVTFNHK